MYSLFDAFSRQSNWNKRELNMLLWVESISPLMRRNQMQISTLVGNRLLFYEGV